MINLWRNFLGYTRIYCSRIVWVLLFACVFFLIFMIIQENANAKSKRQKKRHISGEILLSIACSVVFVMTLFGRKSRDYNFELQFLNSYIVAFEEGNSEILLQIIMNIFMYIPVGFLLPHCFKAFKKMQTLVLVAFISSLTIELIQGFGKLGVFETDDIVNNIMGAVLGMLIYKTVVRIAEYFQYKKCQTEN